LRGKISATKDSLSAYQKELQPIDRLMASQLAMENALAKKISTLRDDTGTAQSEYRSSSAGIGRLQSELVALEKQSQKVARWRTIGLASFLLVAVCLLIGAPTAVPVLAAVGSSGACLTIQRVLRSLRGKVQAKRKLLISTTARAVAAFTRLGRKQQELTVAENEYTAARNSRDRLTIEQQSLRLKVKESSATVSTIEAELGCYQEIRVVEERAHLLELLGACAEVEHGRRA
jgi:chromosome segregation ATPase